MEYKMSDAEYLRCRFSVTVFTDDLAVVHCLRSLCEYAEEGVRGQIGWGGTTKSNWVKNGNQITLRFSNPSFREVFLAKAKSLLAPNSWYEVSRSDNNPATRQRK